MAAPESIVSAARAMPSPRSAARPAATKAAAALSRTTSRRGPASPASTASTSAAFSAGVPPARAESGAAREAELRGHDLAPRHAGRRDVVEDARSVERQLVHAVAVDHQRPLGAEQPQHLGDLRGGLGSADAHDLAARAGRVGHAGRCRLKAVRTPISRRVGPACFMAG